MVESPGDLIDTAIATAPAHRPRRGRSATGRRQPWLAFRGRLSPPALMLLCVLGWLSFVSIWQLAVRCHLAPEVLLVGPAEVLAALGQLFAHAHFARDVWVSVVRIGASFSGACLVAYPIGLVMGAVPVAAGFLNPVLAAFRYLPAPSFVPLLLMALGPGDAEKIALLFLGVVFFLITLIMDNTQTVPIELVESAATLGASRRQVLTRIIVPASLPGVVVAMRQMLAVSWTYLVVAEIVAADEGIGAVMVRSQRLLKTDRILACILAIGLLGFLSDLVFAGAHRLAFPYLRRAR